MLAVDILSLMPGFVSGSHQLHNILIFVTFTLAVTGLLLLANQGFRERSLAGILPTIIRIIVVVILVGSLGTFGDLLMSGVNDVIGQMGLNSASGGIFEAYRQAVAQKFGSDGAGQSRAPQSVPQQNTQQPSTPVTEGDTSGGFSPTTSGIQLTHYGSSSDLTGDSNSLNGIGNHNNQLTAYQNPSTPASAALSDSVASQYGVSLGQSFTATVNGTTYNLTYDDTVPSSFTDPNTGETVAIGPRVDIFDPNNVLGGANSFSGDVTSINGGPGAQGDGGFLGGWISRIGDSLTVGLLYPLVHLLSLIALGIMWLMQAVQQILYSIEIAVSPIFLGFLMIPRLVGTATKFLLSLAAITLWGLGWAVADLLTRALIAFAVNPTNNAAQSVFSAGSMMLGYWVLLALWVIGSSFFAPLIISAMLMSGSSGIAPLFGATVGAAAATAARSTGAVAHVAGAALAPISIASHSAMNAFNNYARRPSASPVTGNGNRSA